LCDENLDRSCPACNARRRLAVRLIEGEGMSVDATAATMGLSAERVERLLEEDADRRQIANLIQAEIENATLRERLDARRRMDPTLTSAELARRLQTSPVQVERWLGLRPTAPKTDRRGRTYPARVLDRVSVEVAGRLARAAGYAPCEIEGC
jgi:hypothetical protein